MRFAGIICLFDFSPRETLHVLAYCLHKCMGLDLGGLINRFQLLDKLLLHVQQSREASIQAKMIARAVVRASATSGSDQEWEW